MLQETALVLRPTQALPDELTFQGHALPYTETVEVLGKARLPLLVDHEDEVDIV